MPSHDLADLDIPVQQTLLELILAWPFWHKEETYGYTSTEEYLLCKEKNPLVLWKEKDLKEVCTGKHL